MTGNPDLDTLPHSIKILVLDWDRTCCNFHLHGFLASQGLSDYGSSETNAVTKEHLDKLFDFEEGDEDSPIKNPEQLKSVLQKAFEQKVIVAIASFTSYPKAVEYVVQNYLGLSKEQAESIKVVGGLPPEAIRTEYGKNLHILTHILECLEEYKEKHNGALPEKVEVMLVDDDQDNIDCIKKFNIQIDELLEFIKNNEEIQKLLKINSKTINTPFTAEDLKEKEKKFIELTGIQVPKDRITQISEEDKQKEHYDYLDQGEKWVGVHYEELTGSIDKKKGQKRTLKFAETVKVQYIPLEGQEGAFAERKRRKEEKKAQYRQGSNVCTSHTPVATSTNIDNGGDGIKNSGNQKLQLWKKGLVIVAPAVIGLIVFGSLTKAVPLSPLNAFGIGVVIAALTVIVYVLEELLLKPELKPKSILKELGEKVNNLFAKEEKTQVVQQVENGRIGNFSPITFWHCISKL